MYGPVCPANKCAPRPKKITHDPPLALYVSSQRRKKPPLVGCPRRKKVLHLYPAKQGCNCCPEKGTFQASKYCQGEILHSEKTGWKQKKAYWPMALSAHTHSLAWCLEVTNVNTNLCLWSPEIFSWIDPFKRFWDLDGSQTSHPSLFSNKQAAWEPFRMRTNFISRIYFADLHCRLLKSCIGFLVDVNEKGQAECSRDLKKAWGLYKSYYSVQTVLVNLSASDTNCSARFHCKK